MTGPRKTDPYRNSRLMTTPAAKTPSSLSCGPVAAKGIPSREFQLAATPRLRPFLSRNARSPFVDDAVEDDEPRVSEEAAQNVLVDLVAQAYVAEVPVDQGSDVVPGFARGIRLLPHQVFARAWMRDREKGSAAGGILADDMGYVYPFGSDLDNY